MYFTSGNDRAFEQPQPRPEQPDEAAPGLENSVLENPTSDNPTPGNPTLENPMQLNKDISSKEKTTTDVSITDSIPILSRPFPSEDEAAQPPERKGTGAKSQSAIEIYREIIMDNIEYEHLCQHAKGIDRETLDEIVDLLVETVCSVRKTIRIAGDDYPAELVKSKFIISCNDIIGNYPKRRARRCQSLCVRRSFFLCLPHWEVRQFFQQFQNKVLLHIFVNGQLVDHGSVVFDHFLFSP